MSHVAVFDFQCDSYEKGMRSKLTDLQIVLIMTLVNKLFMCDQKRLFICLYIVSKTKSIYPTSYFLMVSYFALIVFSFLCSILI